MDEKTLGEIKMPAKKTRKTKTTKKPSKKNTGVFKQPGFKSVSIKEKGKPISFGGYIETLTENAKK